MRPASVSSMRGVSGARLSGHVEVSLLANGIERRDEGVGPAAHAIAGGELGLWYFPEQTVVGPRVCAAHDQRDVHAMQPTCIVQVVSDPDRQWHTHGATKEHAQ